MFIVGGGVDPIFEIVTSRKVGGSMSFHSRPGLRPKLPVSEVTLTRISVTSRFPIGNETTTTNTLTKAKLYQSATRPEKANRHHCEG